MYVAWRGALGDHQAGSTPVTGLWLCVYRGGVKEETVSLLTSEGLPGTCPISSHFTHFLYVTGTPPAAALVVVPRVCGSVYVPGSPEKPGVSSTTPISTDFYSQKL